MPTPLQSNGTNGSGAAPSLQYTSNVSSGTVLLAAVGIFNPYSVTAVKDGAGNSFTQIAATEYAGTANNGQVSLWALATPTGDVATKPVITATLAGSGGEFWSMVIQEVPSIQAVADGTAGIGSGVGTGANVACAAYSSAAAGEYLIALYSDDVDVNNTAVNVPTGSTTYTRDAHSQDNEGNNTLVLAYGSSTGGAETATFSFSATNSGNSYGTFLVAFKLAGGAAAPAPVSPYIPVPPGWFPGADGKVNAPGDIPFSGDPQPADTGIHPPAALVLPPLQGPRQYPPGWFPGADGRVCSPGDIPFSGDPQPGYAPQAPGPPPTSAVIAPAAVHAPGWFPGADGTVTQPGGVPFTVPLAAAVPATQVPYIAGISASTSTQAGYFTDQNGNPRLWVCDQMYGLVSNAGRWNGSGGGTYQQDYDSYFAERAAQGVTAVLVEPVGSLPNGGAFDNGNTWDNVPPFNTGQDPTSGLNPAYWARFDYMLNSALAAGITIFPIFDITYNSASGECFNGWTDTQFQAFGAALGGRYKNQPNLMWMFGDDTFPTTDDTHFDHILTGLTGAGDTHPLTAMWLAEYTSRYETDNNLQSAWGTAHSAFNSCYTYNAGYWTIEYAYGEVASEGASALLPVVWNNGYHFQGGATYDHTNDRSWRQEIWWCLTAGARGVTTYSHNNYLWNAAGDVATVTSDWSFANSLNHVVSTYQSWPEWYKLLPDLSSSFVTAGRGSRVSGLTSGGGGGAYEPAFTNSWVTASITPDGTLAVCYLPNSTTITVNTSLLAAGWTASWIDPVSGAATAAGAGPTYNSTAKGNNSQGDPDWALVFQAPSAVTVSGAAALSGSGTLTAPPTLGYAAALSGSGSLAASGVFAGAATLSGTGTLTEAVTLGYTAPLSGSGTLTASGIFAGAAALSGSGTLSIPGVILGYQAALSGTGTLTAAGVFAGAAPLSGSGSLLIPGVTIGYQAALSGSGTLTAAGVFAAGAALSGAGTLTATGGIAGIFSGAAVLSGSGTLTGQVTLGYAVALDGEGALTAGVTLGYAAVLSGAGSITAAWQYAAAATLSGLGALTGTGTVLSGTAALLSGQGTLATIPALGYAVTLSGTGLLLAAAGVITPVPFTSLWLATPLAPRWQAVPLAPRWHATPAAPRWKAALMNFEPIAAISLEYLNMLWTADLAGTEVDPTGQTAGQAQLPVLFAVPQSSGNPLEPAEPQTWFTAVWLTGGNIRGFVAQGLVGPSPALVQLTAGLSYDVWSEITATPESPRKFCGTVAVY